MMRIFSCMKRKHMWMGLLILLCLALLWICFLRDPIMPGEKDAGRLAKQDRIQSEKILESMPEQLKTAINKKLVPTYGEHLLFLKADKTYYAMVDVNGTLLEIDQASGQATEVFSVHKYTCSLKVKHNRLHFLTGRRQSRDKRSLAARLIHPSKVGVLTEIQAWEYDFLSGELKEEAA